MSWPVFKLRSLKSRVTLFTLLIFVLSMWSLAFYASRMLRDDMQRLLSEQQFSAVSFIAGQVNQELDGRLRGLEQIAATVNPADLARTPAMQAFLAKRVVLQVLFNGGLTAFQADGKVVAEAPLVAGRVGINYMDRDFVAAALKEGKSTVGRPVIGKKLGAPLFIIAVPIRDTVGKVIGALAGVTDLSKPSFLDEITQNNYGKQGEFLLIAPQSRQIVSATDKRRIMEVFPPSGVIPSLDRFLQGEEGSGVALNPQGVEVLASAKSIPLAGWVFAATLPTAEAFAPIRAMQQRMLLATIFLTLLAGLLTWWMLRGQLAALSVAVETLTALAHTEQPAQPLPIKRDDEIGLLISGFNGLLEILAERKAALQKNEEKLRAITDNVKAVLFLKDLNGRYLYVNQQYEALLQVAKTAIEGKTDYDIFPAPIADAFTRNDQQVLTSGLSLEIEEQVPQADGLHVYLSVKLPVRDEKGTIYALCGIAYDITERKHQEVEQRIAAAAFESQEAMIITDAHSVILRVNRAFTEITGYTEAEVLGQTPRRFQSGRYPAEFYRQMWETITRTDGWQGEIWDRRKNGEEYPKWLTISAVRDSAGAVSHYVGAHFDISQRKQAEALIERDREQQEVLRQLLDIVVEGGCIETALQGVLDILLGVSWLSLLPKGGVFLMEKDNSALRLCVARNIEPEILRSCERVSLGYCLCGQAAASGTLQYAANVDACHMTTYPGMSDHGHYCVPIISEMRKLGVLMLYLPPDTPRNVHNETFLVSVSSILATYLLRTQAEQLLLEHQGQLEEMVRLRTADLQTSEARTRAVLTTMLDGVVHIDAVGRMLSVNNAILEMFGYATDELLEQNVRLLMPEQYAKAHDGYLQRYAQSGVKQVVGSRRQVAGRRKDGSVFPIELAVNELLDQSGSTFIGVIRDMTEQKDAEQELHMALHAAQSATQTKGRFLANMSHEIRTPLNAVLGLAQIGLRDSAGRQAGKTFARIVDAGEHLLGVINDILDLSKIEAGKLQVEAQPFALLASIESVVNLLNQRIEAKGLRFNVVLSPDLPAWVMGDSLRLGQILTNLLSNALKFTATGEICLQVTQPASGDAASGPIDFAIIDSGIGMSEEQLARVFDAFEQADSSTTRSYGGTGLGLAISQDLAHLMGGVIGVESQLGRGSCFTLRLNLPMVAAPLGGERLPSQGQASLAGLSVLVADDVEANRLLLEDILEHAGARVVFAEDGQQVLEHLQSAGKTAFDVVLMDVQMPVMDGLDATRWIRSFAPDLPVLGLTAHAMREEHEKCLSAGMVDVLTKPLNIGLLVAAILRQVPPDRLTGEQSSRPSSLAASLPQSLPGGLIDWSALLARYNGRRTFIKKLANSLCASHSETPGKLRIAAQQGDREALLFMVHSLKGISGNMEAPALHAQAKVLEGALRDESEIVLENIEKLALTVESFLVELDNPELFAEGAR